MRLWRVRVSHTECAVAMTTRLRTYFTIAFLRDAASDNCIATLETHQKLHAIRCRYGHRQTHPTKKPWSFVLPPRYCSSCAGLAASTLSIMACSAAGSEICTSPFASTSAFTPSPPAPCIWVAAAT